MQGTTALDRVNNSCFILRWQCGHTLGVSHRRKFLCTVERKADANHRVHELLDVEFALGHLEALVDRRNAGEQPPADLLGHHLAGRVWVVDALSGTNVPVGLPPR
jgi:hypothetical protein